MNYLALFVIVFCLYFQGYAEEQDADLSICNDQLYLRLKAKDINSLNEREYEYMMRVEKDCNQMKLLKTKQKEANKGQSLKAVGSVISILLSLTLAGFLIYSLSNQ